MKIKPPYIPLYVNDILGSRKVENMNTKAFGAYCLLMIKSWHDTPPCSIPNDDTLLARMSNMTIPEWRKIKDSVLCAWDLGRDNRYYQNRLLNEFKKSKKICENSTKKAKKAVKARWDKAKQEKELHTCVIHENNICNTSQVKSSQLIKTKDLSSQRQETDVNKQTCILAYEPKHFDLTVDEYMNLVMKFNKTIVTAGMKKLDHQLSMTPNKKIENMAAYLTSICKELGK